MEAKEFLQQAFSIDQQIKSKNQQLEALKALATSTTQAMSGMPGSPNRNIHKMENAIVKMTSLEDEIREDIVKLVNLKVELKHVIDGVRRPEYRLILEERYLCYFTWEEIADDLHCSVRSVQTLHGKALEAVKVPEEYRAA
ncbi:sigma factor-like helix-turn-helix DNA-binding protein [Bilifractor sp. HCP3S3_D3]|uniref:sigma factor-like helix-turn-helix DNA-binding protein n=1 Tax=Bilifractor sp. HCP3S3_D3 TaxID=3438907 RepID=UPI003F8BD80A